MNAKPTRNQWKGYAIICLILSLALLAMVFRPALQKTPQKNDHSQLKSAIDSFGDNIISKSEAARKNRYYPNRHDTTTHYKRHRNADYSQHREIQSREITKRQLTIELNSADTSELQKLYGIGPVFANRIVKYRQLLGGYVRREQLMEVYGMDAERYDGIADNITVDTSLAKKLDINNASIAELRQHPYIDYYQAKAIVDFRRQGNQFSKQSDLLLVNLMDEETVTKLQGYIQF